MNVLMRSVIEFVESLSEEHRIVLNAFLSVSEENDQVSAVDMLRREHGSILGDVENLVETRRQRLRIGYDAFRFLLRVFSGDERGVRLIADMTLPGGAFKEENPFGSGMHRSGWEFHTSFVQRLMPKLATVSSFPECRIIVALPGDFREDLDIRGCLPREHSSSGSDIVCVWKSIASGEHLEFFGADHAVVLYTEDIEANDVAVYFSPMDDIGQRTAYVLNRDRLATWMDDIRIIIPVPTR